MIGVIGLGYVGLPLARTLSRCNKVLGFDTNPARIHSLSQGIDYNEIDHTSFELNSSLVFSANIEDLAKCNIFIICVPTPLDSKLLPDLSLLESAATQVGEILKKGDLVVVESTVYPGCTNGFVAPLLEARSKLVANRDFYIGYSPERVNPGDQSHSIESIVKVVSGNGSLALEKVRDLYSSICLGGLFEAADIETAEASKLVENIQRDMNIAIMNELSVLFGKLDLSTRAVLDAARTKWNFVDFYPGLVGGHCIGIDPYYMKFAADGVGMDMSYLLAGRRINENFSKHVANMIINNSAVSTKGNPKVLVYGVTFKPNVRDHRNTKVVDVYRALESRGVTVDLYDPVADVEAFSGDYGIEIFNSLDEIQGVYDSLLVAVGHDALVSEIVCLKAKLSVEAVIVDLSSQDNSGSWLGYDYLGI